MSEGTQTEAAQPAATEAERALERLTEMSADLRGAAILGAGGEVLAASGEAAAWGDGAAALLDAADAAGEGDADHVHVATGDGEVFALRAGGLAAVAVTERFVLASLMLFDMRSVLRDLAGAA